MAKPYLITLNHVHKRVAFTIHEPLGVFACIVPFNYPVELAAHKTAPMLVTGNSVILSLIDTPMGALILCELSWKQVYLQMLSSVSQAVGAK